MNWKDILKRIAFDPTESCCSELKNNFLEFVEKLSDYYESIGINNNMRMHYMIADGPCEDVLDAVNDFLEGAKNPPKGSKLPSWATGELQQMLDNFEECKSLHALRVPIQLQRRWQ